MYHEPINTEKPCKLCRFKAYDSFLDYDYCFHNPLPLGLENEQDIVPIAGTCEYYQEQQI